MCHSCSMPTFTGPSEGAQSWLGQVLQHVATAQGSSGILHLAAVPPPGCGRGGALDVPDERTAQTLTPDDRERPAGSGHGGLLHGAVGALGEPARGRGCGPAPRWARAIRRTASPGSRRRPARSRARCSSRTGRSGRPARRSACPAGAAPRCPRGCTTSRSTSDRTTAPVRGPTGGAVDLQPAALEEVQRADRVGAARLRDGPAGAGLQDDVPDRDVGLGPAGPRVRRRGRRREAGQLAGDHRDLDPVLAQAGDVAVPEHREVRRRRACPRPAGSARSGTARAGSAARRRATGTSRSGRCPPPAVSHCTSPRPNRAAAPSESEWSMRPLRT